MRNSSSTLVDHSGRALTPLGQAQVLCHVPRWSIVPHTRAQSVAEHTFMVTAIARALVVMCSDPSVDGAAVTYLALDHDLDESMTGDIPSPCKTHPDSPTLERAIVRLADMTETACYIKRYGIPGPRLTEVLAGLDYRIANHISVMEIKWPLTSWSSRYNKLVEVLNQ